MVNSLPTISWNDLKHFMLKVSPNLGKIAVTDGETLYWYCFVNDNQYECFIHPYLLARVKEVLFGVHVQLVR